MLHYIIDGYNVLKQLPDLEKRTLKDGRFGLIRYFEICRPQGSIKNRVTIVFDGKSEVDLPSKQILEKSNLEIIFSRDETADDKIKKLVRRIPNPKQVIVVTDDRELQLGVRMNGIKTIPVKEIIGKKKPQPEEKNIKQKGILEIREMEKINKELEKVWL